MKAYKDAAGKVRLFRPELNIRRLNNSMARLRFPTVDENVMIDLLRYAGRLFTKKCINSIFRDPAQTGGTRTEIRTVTFSAPLAVHQHLQLFHFVDRKQARVDAVQWRTNVRNLAHAELKEA